MVSAAIFGIVFLTNSDFVFAGDSSQTPATKSVPSIQASTLTYETARFPMSNLNLILTGTIIGTPGRALIRVEGRQDELFAVGQAIARGVFLADVYQRGAVIRHDGVLEKLALRSGGKSQDLVRSKPDLPAMPVPNEPVPNEPLPDETDRDRWNGSHYFKRVFADKLFEYPDLLAHAKIIPVPNGGMQISDIAPGSFFEQLGLSDGDAIRTINGTPVNSISDFVNRFQQRNNTDRLQVGVARSGNLYNMQFDPESGIEIKMVSELLKQ